LTAARPADSIIPSFCSTRRDPRISVLVVNLLADLAGIPSPQRGGWTKGRVALAAVGIFSGWLLAAQGDAPDNVPNVRANIRNKAMWFRVQCRQSYSERTEGTRERLAFAETSLEHGNGFKSILPIYPSQQQRRCPPWYRSFSPGGGRANLGDGNPTL